MPKGVLKNQPPYEPRPDGQCARCESDVAVTIDQRFCAKCLKSIVDADFRAKFGQRDLSRRGTEQIGRPARDAKESAGMMNDRYDEESDPLNDYTEGPSYW